VLPGALRELLQEAIATDCVISVMYVNKKQETRPHRVLPIELRTGIRGEQMLYANDLATGSNTLLSVDRITAVR
jgi:hypothetical protein